MVLRDLSIGSGCVACLCMVCTFFSGILTFYLYISHVFLKQFLYYLYFIVIVVVAVVIFCYII